MIEKIRKIFKGRGDRKAREKHLGNIALSASTLKYPEEDTIRSPWILEDDRGIVVGLFYKSDRMPARRRFWQISGQTAEEIDVRNVTSRFQLGPYR
jgi:hypothetical protein